MDGKDALRRLRQLLDEESTGTWLDDRTSYDYLWEAAKEFVRRTKYHTGIQRIETATDVRDYALNADFGGMYLKDGEQRYFMRFFNVGGEHRIFFEDYEEIEYNESEDVKDLKQGTLSYKGSDTKLRDTLQDFTDYTQTASADTAYKITIYQNDNTKRWAYIGTCPDTTNSTDYMVAYKDKGWATAGFNGASAGTPSYYTIENISSQAVPGRFTIRPKEELYDQITGSATATGDATAGECTLEDTSASFLTTDYVSAGDHIHNTTDSSTGIVLEVLTANTIKVALFGGTNNNWTTGDAYVIQPMGRMQVTVDPAPSTKNLLMEIPYVKMPAPVYADYRTYNFPQPIMEAIIKYAAWMYKYRDGQPEFGDMLYVMWDKACREFHRSYTPAMTRRRFRVNFRRSGLTHRSR